MRIIRPREAQKRLGIGKSKYWQDVKNGVLPPLLRLGPKSVGHLEDEIDAHIKSLRANCGSPSNRCPGAIVAPLAGALPITK